MKLWNVRRVAAVLLSAFAANAFAQTKADAQKAYVAGKWQEAAAAYETACPKEPDSLKTECLLWNVLALSQTGNAKDFSKAGKRLDSLIQKTSPPPEGMFRRPGQSQEGSLGRSLQKALFARCPRRKKSPTTCGSSTGKHPGQSTVFRQNGTVFFVYREPGQRRLVPPTRRFRCKIQC